MSTASAANIQIQLPDGKIIEQAASKTAMDVAAGISEGLARAVVAAEVDGTIVDSDRAWEQMKVVVFTWAEMNPLKSHRIRDRWLTCRGALQFNK